MVTIGNEITCIRVLLRKGDDFRRVFEFKKQDGSDLEFEDENFRWDFFKDRQPIFSIYGAGIVVVDNQIDITIPASLFAGFPPIGNYSHRFYDSTDNTTFFEGSVLIDPGTSTTQIMYAYYGPAAESVTDSDSIKDLPFASFLSTGAMILQTGTSLTKFVLAIPSHWSVDTIIDLSALNIQMTGDYELMGQIPVNTNSGPVNYNVFEMDIAVPYSVNHNHQITLM